MRYTYVGVQIGVDVLGQEDLVFASGRAWVEAPVLGPVTPVRDETPGRSQFKASNDVNAMAYLWSNVPDGGTYSVLGSMSGGGGPAGGGATSQRSMIARHIQHSRMLTRSVVNLKPGVRLGHSSNIDVPATYTLTLAPLRCQTELRRRTTVAVLRAALACRT